ncbi:flagellar hook assembly protein FlgD [Methylocystis parvus]|uniref:Basal-body rod modification protein FlgD n=1 Tax=Methylocystis parvus TaxID=134 RepID=A0A6B8M9P8_9HYPH|nr:flagellar hook assembly protein FlgD [Methylocystis parvus]QGM98003.1 flagellar hook assembly protein FlgD [Methylocystis parvus]WBK01681.1 flagellar hook assembly protein FlgD [Methylocystis parvus OBBP]
MSIPLVQNNVSSAASSSTASLDATKLTGDFNAFLQLLVTQLKNQDPTKPLDPTQTVSQLATFSNVEQAVKTNALLERLSDMSTLSQASALIGKTATAADGSASGLIASVTMTDAGLIATLKDGRQLALGPGVTIS